MGSTKKLLLAGAAAAVMLFAIAAPAFAGGYLAWTAVSSLPGNAPSPHGGYTATTTKCQVCHAVHYANATGQMLLNSTVAAACNYCHVGGAGGYTQVYAGVPTNYDRSSFTTDIPWAHNANLPGGVGVTCTDCHQVHAAQNVMTANAALTIHLLKAQSADPTAGLPAAGDATYTAMSKWCADCHYSRGVNGMATSSPSGVSQYYSLFDNAPSHVLTSAANTFGNPAATTTTRVAYADANTCMNCHAAGTAVGAIPGLVSAGKTATYSFPHYTLNAVNFLESAQASGAARSAAATNDADGVCLACHRQVAGATTNGIGFTF